MRFLRSFDADVREGGASSINTQKKDRGRQADLGSSHRLALGWVALAFGSVASSCASFHKLRMYPGSERPPEFVTILRGSRFLNLVRVDGKAGDYMPALRGPAAYKGFELHFLPGKHTVTVYFDKQTSGIVGGATYGGVYLTETTITSELRTLEFDGEAGRIYFVYSGESAIRGDRTWNPFIGDITGWEELGGTPEP